MNNITIKPLSPALLDDYLNFFDNDAFADNPYWASCYCRCYHFDHEGCDWDKTTAKDNRNAVIKMIKNNEMSGYLAFDGNKPVGWLNANARNNYSVNSYKTIDKSENIGSLICFLIAKDYRRQGIAKKLLNAAIDGFKQQGFEFAEGYPVKGVKGDDKNYHGPMSLYLSAGFYQYDENDVVIVMRKKLK